MIVSTHNAQIWWNSTQSWLVFSLHCGPCVDQNGPYAEQNGPCMDHLRKISVESTIYGPCVDQSGLCADQNGPCMDQNDQIQKSIIGLFWSMHGPFWSTHRPLWSRQKSFFTVYSLLKSNTISISA